MTDLAALAERQVADISTCRDFDKDCEAVPDKAHCWLYDPAKGMCPYLRAKGSQ